MNKGTYKPFIKPNNTPLCIHRESKHPLSIIRSIPAAINKRLNETSSNKEDFDEAEAIYQQALNNSGYDFKLEFQQAGKNYQNTTGKKTRCRNITWFNSPYSNHDHVKTNVGRKFLNIVKDCFKTDRTLKKIFNKNTLKLIYSYMPDPKRKIDTHNKSLFNTKAYTNTREAMQLPITTQLPAERELSNH